MTSRIDLSFYSRADGVTIVDALLAALADDPALAPQKVGTFEPYKIPFPSAQANALWHGEARRAFGSPGGERKRPFSIVVTCMLGFGPDDPFHFFDWSADIRVLEIPDAVARIEALFRRLAVAFRAWYADATHGAEFERQNTYVEPTDPKGLLRNTARPRLHLAIPGLYWLNYFGPEYTRFIGPDRLRALEPPGEMLGDGTLVKLGPSPLDLLTPAAIERTEAIKRRLGADLFFDIAHPDRKTRAPFVPAPKAVDPQALPAIDVELPSLPNPRAFVAGAAERAVDWRRRHGMPVPANPTFKEARAVLQKIEAELARGLPEIGAEEIVADALAVLGQLIVDRLGGGWQVTEGDHLRIVTGRGEIVDPLARILKRTGDPTAHLYPWFHGLVTETLPPPLRPPRPPRTGDGSA